MEVLQFGGLSVREMEDGIQFSSASREKTCSQVSTDDIPVLMSFLKNHLEQSANRRSSWRLGLHQLVGTEADALTVSVSNGSRSIAVAALDISLTGMFVQAESPVGERGDELAVDVRFQGDTARLRATIVRQDYDMTRLALHFPDCVDEQGNPAPPDAYQQIFIALEHIWMDKQLGLQWS